MKKNALRMIRMSAVASALAVNAFAADDNAGNSAYNDGWQTGDNGGTGWDAGWTIGSSGQAGAFVGTSQNNGFGDGNIDTAGKSWGMWAYNGGSVTADRIFPTLQVGQSFVIDFDNGFVDSGGWTGFLLTTAGGDPRGRAYWRLFFRGGDATYTIGLGTMQGYSEIDTGIPFTTKGLHVVFTITGNGCCGDYTYSVAITPNGGAAKVFSGNTASINVLELYSRTTGVSAQNNSFFNNIGIVGNAAARLQWIGNTYAYPASNAATAADDVWINTETWQIANGQSAQVGYSVDGGATYAFKYLDWWYNDANNSHWHINLGKFPAGTTIRYYVSAKQGATELYDMNGGSGYTLTIKAPSVQWAGNVWNWPLNGQIKPTDDFWVNIETWPKGSANYARVVFSTDGVNWFSSDMTIGGQIGNNDWWHVNLGKFASRKTIQYAIEVRDANGKSIWANNNGANYRATVN